MGEWKKLRAEDGHELSAYAAEPDGELIAGLVVIQEIFGVNGHIRSVVESYAKDGFFTIAPAIFDRVERDVDLGYESEGMQAGRAIAMRLKPENVLKDTRAAIDYARSATGKKVGIIGYCLGGSVAWQAACRLDVDAAVGYYGSQIAQQASEMPKCPVMLHFGNKDAHITPEMVDKIVAAHPEIPIYRYEAGHGFNCDTRASYDAPSAKLARERSLEFLKKALA
jgi:carboxymethylenebutenolidase